MQKTNKRLTLSSHSQAWLQEFCWTEEEKPSRKELRSSSLRPTSKVRSAVDREPMFCFETAIKLYYFSHISYFFHQVLNTSSMLSIQYEVYMHVSIRALQSVILLKLQKVLFSC